ncbi:MAG: type II toxin-antitoxin system VapB family antitoxin [Clostridiales bacterium]|nr:type II toxin-antitoxin system VapB family antitoxin [Clostridiales bacterium]
MRTNIMIDDALMSKAIEVFGIKTKKEKISPRI